MAVNDKGFAELTLDAAELAVLMCEANYKLKRPGGMTAQQALDAMQPEVRAAWTRSANVALRYFAEQAKAALEGAG